MCGIAGLIGDSLMRRAEKAMLDSMARRGPDGRGVYREPGCTLLHTRLAIIDPSGGAQPMILRQGNQSLVISYNGELYNTAQLRTELEKLGHQFLGHSDTEVLLHGYSEWGTDVLEKLNGIFAFAVWENHNQKLFLARDRMGVKPLFYAQQGRRLVFGSEIKTILASGIEAVLTEEGVCEMLLLGPGRTPGSGVFRDIKELEPGCCAVFEGGRLQINRYWRLMDRPHTDTFSETLEKVRWLVTDAVKRQMCSDVPIGTFLSGGLDSSLITSICASNSAGRLPTFSVDYKDNDKYFVPGKFQPNSDAQYIERMRTSLNTEHHQTVLTPEALLDVLQDATIARDLPGMADVDFSLLAFCANIRKHVKVALSGECADEIFGGYPWYRDPEIQASDGFPWAQNTKYRASFLANTHINCQEFVRQRYMETVRNSDILPETNAIERQTKEMVNLNMRWFMQTLLDRKDRMSMYHGLEVRVPFCDHRIVEYMYTVPWEFKDHMGKEKGLLRRAMEGVLPTEVLWRKKSPYPKTHDPRYTALTEAALRQLLTENDAPIFGMIKREMLCSLLTNDEQWPWYGQLMRRPQTIAYMLQLNFWLKAYRVKLA